MAKLTLIALSAILAVALAQTGRYRPSPSVSILSSGRTSGTSGRYNPDSAGRYSGGNDGRYTPDNSGRYSGNDGRYYHDDSGKYSHDDNKYQHQGDKYQHQDDKYKHQGGGAGRGSGAGAGAGFGAGAGAGFGAGAGAGFGAGSTSGAGTKRPVASGSGAGSRYGAGAGGGISAAGGFGVPVGLKQGSAAGKYDNRNYAIIRQEGAVEEDGYHYLYETENGIYGEEQGRLANRGTDAEAMRASGYFTYTGPDSVEYTVRYTADENGFVPEAAHLPTPPPIPEAIARALEWQRQNPTL